MSLKDKASIVLTRGAASKAGSIAAWNPQAQEIVSLATTQATANLTRVNEEGLIEAVSANVLLRDFVNGGCGEFNIWPQRTNFMLQSEDIASWTAISGVGTTANNQTSPDGTTNADTITGDGTSTSCRLNKSVSGLSDGEHVFSCFLKAGTNNFAAIDVSGFVGGSGTSISFFDLQNGTTPTSGAKIKYYGNGWYYCQSAPYTVDAGDTSGNMSLYITLSDTIRDFTSAGDANGQSIYAWGAQVEAGSYATAYIPTTASTETRDAIVPIGTAKAALIGDAAGGIYMEAKVFDTSRSSTISLNDNTTNNRVELTLDADVSLDIVVGGASQAAISGGTVSDDTYTKVSGAYAVNSFSAYQDGASIGTDSSGSTYSDATLTQFEFNNAAGTQAFEGAIRNLTIFNQRPTDSQQGSITT